MLLLEDRRWYVYRLLLADGTPFYVGLGKGGRIDRHVLNCLLIEDTFKNRIIRKVIREIGYLPREKIAVSLTRKEAMVAEIAEIARLGRRPRGPLCNLSGGGEPNFDPPLETRMRMSRNISTALTQTHCKRGHELTDDNTYKAPGWRSCKLCARARAAARNRRHPKPKRPRGANIGMRNGMAKLTDEQVRAIMADTRSQRLIGRDYGVTQSHVCKIKTGATRRKAIGVIR
jgi:hypothetical protein